MIWKKLLLVELFYTMLRNDKNIISGICVLRLSLMLLETEFKVIPKGKLEVIFQPFLNGIYMIKQGSLYVHHN